TKYKGKIVSLAPLLGQLTGFILPIALSAALMIAGSIALTGNTARAGDMTESGGAGTGIWTFHDPADPGVDVTLTPTPEPNGKLTVTTNSGFGIDTTATGGNAIDLINAGGDTYITFTDNFTSTIITGEEIGIYAVNNGTDALSITTKGSVTGYDGDGIDAVNSINGTSLTVYAADVYGSENGIDATNNGSGALTITTTGLVTGKDNGGIDAVNSAAGTSLTVNAANVTGGNHGILAQNKGDDGLSITTTGLVKTDSTDHDGIHAGDYGAGNLIITSTGSVIGGNDGIDATGMDGGYSGTGNISITVSGSVTGGANGYEYGIRTRTEAGETTTITLNSGANVSSAAGNGIYNNDGDSTITVNTGAAVSGKISLNDGSDNLLFSGGDFSGVTIFDGGDDIGTADGWTDTLTFNGSSGTLTGGNVLNWENVIIGAGSSIFFADNMLTVGSVAGTGLSNFGTITTQDGAADDTLTITGNYIGSGGTLAIDAVLGDSSSATDKMVVTGDTSGTSILSIKNLGGQGTITGNGPTDGIQIIQVSGSSNGTFKLPGGIGGGAYLYELFQTDGQDWYLQSSGLLPQIDDYAALSMVFAQPLTLGTLHQRVGHRRGRLEVGGSQGHKGMDGWFRMIGGMRDGAPDNEESFKQEYYYMQGGLDKQIFVNSKGRWNIGTNAHYGQSDTDISHGVNGSDADSDFYGFGFSLTWYGNPDYYGDGYYVDLVTQYSIYESDFSSNRTSHSIDGDNWSFGVEAGKRLHLFKTLPNISLVPQAQIIWVESDFDSFTDDDGARVSSDDGRLLKSRIGLKLERHPVSAVSNQSVGYVIANLNHNIDNETSIDASGVDVDYEDRSTWLGFGAGGTIKVKSNIEIYGEVYTSTSVDSFGDAFSVSGNVGIGISW
ncbi:MAG: autotransporter family protein, partial [Planctomycetota bacterium]